MEFASKGYFLLLLLLIPYILWYFLYRKKNEPTMRMLRAHRLCDGSSADSSFMGQQDGGGYRHYVGDGCLYLYVGRGFEAEPY